MTKPGSKSGNVSAGTGHWVSFSTWEVSRGWGGTAMVVPPPFRLGDPALCGSHPLDTLYYFRLGDLLCFVFNVCLLYFFCWLCILCVPLVLWYCWLGLLTCKNCRPYNLYCVGGDVKPCSINQSVNICFDTSTSSVLQVTNWCCANTNLHFTSRVWLLRLLWTRRDCWSDHKCLNEAGAGRPWLPQAVMDWSSRPRSEETTLD